MSQHFKISDFLTNSEFQNIKKFAQDKDTPFLLMNLGKVKYKYQELKQSLPLAKIFYAVKTNPCDEIISALAELGSNFDIASRYELDQLLSLKISPERISFGNTIKKEKDIAYAFEKGVRLFATDSQSDLEKIATHAPGSKVFFRLMWDCGGADWPLSRKFGAHSKVILKLIKIAKDKSIVPYGISFHVGSQQRDIGQWDDAIGQCKNMFAEAKKFGVDLKMINLGGGFPAHYINPTNETPEYAKEILNFLHEDFGDNLPEIIIEPGRSLVADAGVIVSEVIMVAQKSNSKADKWMYIDIGKFSGLIETIDESIKYPIFLERNYAECKLEPMILAGPTCDSMDTLYENFKYEFPIDTKEGEKMYILTTGAYTASYSAINFNGFPPLKIHFFDW